MPQEPTIALLTFLRPRDSRNEFYIMLCPQPSNTLGIPRGTLSSIRTLTGLRILESELKNLTALSQSPTTNTPIMFWEKKFDRKEIEELRGTLAGEKAQRGRPVSPRICTYEVLYDSKDAKSQEARQLHKALNWAGKLDD